ncbi:Uncharacterized protein At4g02000 [Linum perenne]
MAGRGIGNIFFGQFAAVAPLGERLPKTASVDEPAPDRVTLEPQTAAVQSEALGAPIVDELPEIAVEGADVAGSRGINIPTVTVQVADPDNLVADDAPDAIAHDEVPEDFHDEDDAAVHFTEEDLLEARERAELSLLARIFWEEPRELRVVENSFVQVWKCGRVRIFDVGSGLYQFIFPSVAKRDWVLENQPWFFQRSIIHFTDNMVPTEELFHSLQFMLIWVKIIGLPFSYLTIAVGRKLLAKLGEVVKVGYYDAGTPEGCYIKGRVRMDLLGSFLGTAPVTGVNGASFPAFFQYIGLPCICYLCGWLGHVMADCSHSELVFDENVRSDWICGKADQNEKESQGPQLQPLPFVPQPHARGRGGLPPSVAARLSSNLQRQWAQDSQAGGARGHLRRGFGGPRPLLALPGPRSMPNPDSGRNPRGLGPRGSRPHAVRPLQILAPGRSNSGELQGRQELGQSVGSQAQAPTLSAASFVAPRPDLGRQLGPSSCNQPQAQFAPSGAQLPVQRRRPALGWPLGPTAAASAPAAPPFPAAITLGRGLGSKTGSHETPQSKLMVVPGPTRKSTPSSGSVKRKLLADFDTADGPPTSKSAGPKLSLDGPNPFGQSEE